MADSVIRGDSITREGRFYLDSVLTDPTLPRITVRDTLGVAQLVDAIPTRISAGIFQYAYTVPLVGVLGLWQDEWTGVIASQAKTIIGYFEVLPIGSIVSPPSSTYTYNLGTDVGKLRLLIQDHDMSSTSVALPLEQRSAAFTDEELAQFIVWGLNDLFKAASVALRAWAGNKQLIVIARRNGKGDVEYGQIRRDLLDAAKAFEDLANSTPADAMAEIAWDDFTYRRIIQNAVDRGAD